MTYTLNLLRHMPDSGVTGEIYVPPSFRERVVDEHLNRGVLQDVDLSTLGSFKRLFWEQVNWRHCHVNGMHAQESVSDVFQAAAVTLSHTVNASVRNRLNWDLLSK